MEFLLGKISGRTAVFKSLHRTSAGFPPALYDVCNSQAGRKAVSSSWTLSRGHRQWRRQT